MYVKPKSKGVKTIHRNWFHLAAHQNRPGDGFTTSDMVNKVYTENSMHFTQYSHQFLKCEVFLFYFALYLHTKYTILMTLLNFAFNFPLSI